ncbi:hypothetical protein GCM10009624_18750 [Gordonia sinesedis]
MQRRTGSRARRVTLAAAALGAVVTLSACGGDDPVDAAAVSSPVPSESIAAQAPSSAVGRWVGTWRSGGEQRTATINVVAADPLLATIDVSGGCSATWKEKSRDAARVLVGVQVTFGGCADNEWQVEIGDDSITATDTADPGTTVSFRRA